MRFNQIEYAEFYYKQMIEGGYPGKLLPFILKELEEYPTVIDIGSGTGFFSIPLAEEGHSVTALDPSVEMINIMVRNTPPDILSSVKIIRMNWDNWIGERHDAAISIHSLYPMKDVKKAVCLMNEVAKKKIIIVRDTGGMKTLSGIVREKLGIVSNRDLNDEIVVLLNALSVNWKLVNIYEERKHYIRNIKLEADSIYYQLKLDESSKEDVFNIVNKEIIKSSGLDYFNSVYSDNAYIFD